jgi:hypothetical protein
MRIPCFKSALIASWQLQRVLSLGALTLASVTSYYCGITIMESRADSNAKVMRRLRYDLEWNLKFALIDSGV